MPKFDSKFDQNYHFQRLVREDVGTQANGVSKRDAHDCREINM